MESFSTLYSRVSSGIAIKIEGVHFLVTLEREE